MRIDFKSAESHIECHQIDGSINSILHLLNCCLNEKNIP